MEQKLKSGFTLIEVMIVVILIGILSMMAYASLLDHIYLLRTRDAATNTAAFLNRVSAEAKRRDRPVCVELVSPQEMNAKLCNASGDTYTLTDTIVDTYGVLTGFSFHALSGTGGLNNPPTTVWSSGFIPMVPQIGLSSLPREGAIVMMYSRGFCAAAIKASDQNNAIGYFSRSDSQEDACKTWGTM
jgi:prepilin-type N-terminal cleavage/methylation domain-containing protein